MIQFPNGKINLGLQIMAKRQDKFHDIETVFYPIHLVDALEFIPAQAFQISTSGISMDVHPADNIIVKAYDLVKKDFPQLPLLHIQLLKKIPTGAGLGGGSSDATFMLKMLNEYFKLELTDSNLQQYAIQLGSDCPFFLKNKPCRGSGRGEILEEIKLDLSAYSFVLIKPSVHISTAWAFSQLTISQPLKLPHEIVQQPISTWKEELINDFEIPIFKEFPDLKNIKSELYQLGGIYCSMSGSGSTLYGIFETHSITQIKKAIQENKMFKQKEIFYLD